MEINYLTIIATSVNIAILFAILFGIFKAIKGIKCFINRNKELDKKIDSILNALDKKND